MEQLCWGRTQSKGRIFRGKGFIGPHSHLGQNQPWDGLVFLTVPHSLRAIFPKIFFQRKEKGEGEERGEGRRREKGKEEGGKERGREKRRKEEE